MADFDDGKDDGALRTIGEVSEALGIKAHVLRYWEQQFALLKPLKRSGGRRYYRAKDVAVVEQINRLVNEEGYTLKGAEAVLRASGKDEYDRRRGDRRMGGRRDGEEVGSGVGGDESETLETVLSLGTSSMARFRAIRARLAQAIAA